MVFSSVGSETVDRDWKGLGTELKSNLLRVTFTPASVIPKYASIFFRIDASPDGFGARWTRVYVGSERLIVKVDLLPVGSNFLQVKLSDDYKSQDINTVVSVEQWDRPILPNNQVTYFLGNPVNYFPSIPSGLAIKIDAVPNEIYRISGLGEGDVVRIN